MFEKIFPSDEMSKRERVERALNLQATDRVPLHDQISYNPGVVSMFAGKPIRGHDYTERDIGAAIAKSLDCCFEPYAPCGTAQHTDEEGFVWKNDQWTRWRVARPFADEHGAKDWLVRRTQRERRELAAFDPNAFRAAYQKRVQSIQSLIGETVFMDYSIGTGFCYIFDSMGLDIYSFFQLEYPEVLAEAMEVSTELAVKKINAGTDVSLSPVVLLAEDFATKQGPIFSLEFLREYHFPHVGRLVAAWKNNGMKVLYHSDGNYKKCIPDLMACGVDGFYCLEPNCGMDIVELKNTWPQMVWAGGVDGVDLLERGTPEQVKAEVARHIRETGALENGGMLIASSSEINPTVKPENFKAMVEAC